MTTRWEVLAYPARLPDGRGYVLRLHDDDGRIGLGEARALEGFGSGPAALDAFFSSPGAIPALLDQPRSSSAAPLEAIFAVETALADLEAQSRGVPLVEQMGFARPQSLQNSLLVADKREALQLLGDGHRNFKVKAQGASPDCLALLRSLFDASEGTTRVRVDANGSWDRDTALSFLQQAPRGSISFVEQPFPAGDLDSCEWLRDRTINRNPVPIALDEGAESPDDVHAAARREAAALIVVKPMYRGLHGALAMASAAAECGMGACVTHAMDGTVGRLATMHVAAAVDAICPDSPWPHGLYAPGLAQLADEPVLATDCLLMPAGHGLGCHGLRVDDMEPVCAGH